MKNILFFALSLLIFLISTISSAQAQLLKSIGVRTGWCTTNSNVEESRSGEQRPEKYHDLNDAFFEIQTEYLQKGNLSFITNFSYIPKGYTFYTPNGGSYGFFPSSGNNGPTPISPTAQYFNITIAPKFSFNISEFTLFCLAGLQSGYLAGYDDRFNFAIYSDNPNSYNPDYKLELVLNRITVGGTIGGGISTNRSNKRINYSLQAQYLHDFTKAADYHRSYNFNGNNYFYNLEMKYQTFLLGFGVHYTFKKKE